MSCQVFRKKRAFLIYRGLSGDVLCGGLRGFMLRNRKLPRVYKGGGMCGVVGG